MTVFLRPEKELPYDPRSLSSVVSYAEQLVGKCLRNAVASPDALQLLVRGGKGSLGQKLEEAYFFIRNNSDAEPDLKDIGLELKTTPLRETAGGLRSKERLVLNIINFLECARERDFESSTFWKKNQNLLLFFYLYQKGLVDIDCVFRLVTELRFSAADLKIIRDDWNRIQSKICTGRAHEISERDTLYLGACTKGASKNSLRPQSNGPRAMQRAYALKSQYLNSVISYHFSKTEQAMPDPTALGAQDFETWVIARFSRYYGQDLGDLLRRFKVQGAAKHSHFLLAKKVLGVKGKRIAEFEKANVKVKVIRLKASGTPRESMSFRNIRFKDIVCEKWEESTFRQDLDHRFLFVIFRDTSDGGCVLERVMFWGMPDKDMAQARRVWLDTKTKVAQGDYGHFIGLKERRIAHVRPKGRNAKDLMDAPDGSRQKKKCFWLNADYIRRQVAG